MEDWTLRKIEELFECSLHDLGSIAKNKDMKDIVDTIEDIKEGIEQMIPFSEISKKLDKCNAIAKKKCSDSSDLECFVKQEQWRQKNCVTPALNSTGKELWDTVADTKGALPNPYETTDTNMTVIDENITFDTPISISTDNNSSIPKEIESITESNCYDRIKDTNSSDILIEDDNCDEIAKEYDNP